MSPARPHLSLAATCACGQVDMAIEGPVLAMLMCACTDCQRATGTGHSTAAMVPASALQVTGTTNSFASPADSGATFTRHFCPGCGNPLFGLSSRAPETRMVSVGFFGADTDWFVPKTLIFARSHRAWDAIDPGVARHAAYPERMRP